MKLPAPLSLALISLTCFVLGGCAARTEEKPDPATGQSRTAEAPLGSRIKRKSDIAPVLGATREDLEATKLQQGAIAVGIANDGR